MNLPSTGKSLLAYSLAKSKAGISHLQLKSFRQIWAEVKVCTVTERYFKEFAPSHYLPAPQPAGQSDIRLPHCILLDGKLKCDATPCTATVFYHKHFDEVICNQCSLTYWSFCGRRNATAQYSTLLHFTWGNVLLLKQKEILFAPEGNTNIKKQTLQHKTSAYLCSLGNLCWSRSVCVPSVHSRVIRSQILFCNKDKDFWWNKEAVLYIYICSHTIHAHTHTNAKAVFFPFPALSD